MHRGHFKAVYPINAIHEFSENVYLGCVGIANGMWVIASPAKPIPRLTINSVLSLRWGAWAVDIERNVD